MAKTLRRLVLLPAYPLGFQLCQGCDAGAQVLEAKSCLGRNHRKPQYDCAKVESLTSLCGSICADRWSTLLHLDWVYLPWPRIGSDWTWTDPLTTITSQNPSWHDKHYWTACHTTKFLWNACWQGSIAYNLANNIPPKSWVMGGGRENLHLMCGHDPTILSTVGTICI